MAINMPSGVWEISQYGSCVVRRRSRTFLCRERKPLLTRFRSVVAYSGVMRSVASRSFEPLLLDEFLMTMTVGMELFVNEPELQLSCSILLVGGCVNDVND